MKKSLLFTAIAGLALIVGQVAFAQNNPPKRVCGTMDYKEWEEANDPSIKERRAQIERDMEAYIENQKKNPTPDNAVITIPVVFHIVYNPAITPSQNVTDACIAAQLKRINDDYRKLNSDVSKVTQPGFASLAADCQIEFCMAVRDPNNNPTNGITRTTTTGNNFTTDNKVKAVATGGCAAWDASKYFNIWICNLDDNAGLLGYGQFPGGSPTTDGLVIDFQYMIGTAGCGSAPFDLGRTATHELGHCFNLKHIWGDDNGACTGTDGVADTPNQGAQHYGTIAAGSIKTDACSASSPGTMWMNYMDYSDDACMYMFTAGQKAIIDATMAGPRASLKTSNGCTPLTAVEYLISSESLSVFPNPSTGDVALSVNIPNFSSADVTVYNALGNAVLSKNINSNLVNLDMNNNANGMYFVTLKTAVGSVTKKIVINR